MFVLKRMRIWIWNTVHRCVIGSAHIIEIVTFINAAAFCSMISTRDDDPQSCYLSISADLITGYSLLNI